MIERLLYFLCLMLSKLPWALLYGFSSFLAWVAYTFKIYRYKVVKENLALVFPDKTEKERLKLAKDFYRHLSDSVVETLKLMSVSDESLRCKVEFVGWEQLQAQKQSGRSVVLYLGHYGNWELVPTIVWVIPEAFMCAQIYKPMHNSLGQTVLNKIRNRFGVLNLPQNSAFRTLLSLHKQGQLTITGFIADQRPNGKFQNWTSWLGLPTAYMAGGEEIGRRIDADYYYIDVERIGRGRSRMTLRKVEPASDEPKYPMTVGYMRMLETTIRRDPAAWLWTHKRWAHQLDHKFED